MVLKSSEEVFNETLARLQKEAGKAGDKTRKIRDLRAQMNNAVIKSTFAKTESEREHFSAHAQSLKRQIDFLQRQ